MKFESSEGDQEENLLKVQNVKNVCKLISNVGHKRVVIKTVRSGCKHEPHHTSYRWKSYSSIKKIYGKVAQLDRAT